MGRKIPGKKHKGVKDPEKQREFRINSLRDKINAPPVNPDEQHIPKSLARVMELKDKVKGGHYNKKNKKTQPAKKERLGRYEKPIPQFTQGSGESDGHFLQRVSRMCESTIREAAFEKKYGVEIKRDPETGKVDVVKREKDEVEKMLQEARKEKKQKGKKKKKKVDSEPRLTKAQKRNVKLKEKKQNKLENNIDEFERYTDSVKFGEVAHAPPTLVLPKKAGNLHCAPRPGRKDLHLKSLLSTSNNDRQTASDTKIKKTANRVIDKKGKRKDLPNAMRRQLDRQQEEVIQAYKQLKLKRER